MAKKNGINWKRAWYYFIYLVAFALFVFGMYLFRTANNIVFPYMLSEELVELKYQYVLFGSIFSGIVLY